MVVVVIFFFGPAGLRRLRPPFLTISQFWDSGFRLRQRQGGEKAGKRRFSRREPVFGANADGSSFEGRLRRPPQDDEPISISRRVTMRRERSEPRRATRLRAKLLRRGADGVVFLVEVLGCEVPVEQVLENVLQIFRPFVLIVDR